MDLNPIKHITPYDSRVFNADVISYLNVNSEGDVVSAETWVALWTSFLNFTKHIDKHLNELIGKNGILYDVVEDHAQLKQDHQKIIADYTELQFKFSQLDDALQTVIHAEASAEYAAATATAIASALSEGLVHIGENAPSNPNIKLWIRPSDLADIPATLADVNSKVAKVQGNTMTDQAYAVGPLGDTRIVEIEDNSLYDIVSFAYCIPRRNSSGNLLTKEPTTDLECANKKYVDTKISELSGLEIEIVTALPETGEADKIYFVPNNLEESNNIYDEYIYTNNAWEKVGSANVEVDLTDYVKNTDYATNTSVGLVTINYNQWSSGLSLSSNGRIAISAAQQDEIASKNQSYRPIVPSNLDYAVKVGLTTNTETLTDEEKAQAQSWLGITDLIGDIETLLGGI